MDHVIPRSWFTTPDFVATVGMDDAANLVTCCACCNSLKRDMDLEGYAHYLRGRFGKDTRAMVARTHRQLRKPV